MFGQDETFSGVDFETGLQAVEELVLLRSSRIQARGNGNQYDGHSQ